MTGGDYPYYTGKTTIESVQTGNWHWVYKKVTEITEDVTLQTNNTGTTIIGSTGNDPITTRGKKILINGDAGNDSIKIFGSSYADSFIYSSGDGQRCKISRRSRLYDFLQQKKSSRHFQSRQRLRNFKRFHGDDLSHQRLRLQN